MSADQSALSHDLLDPSLLSALCGKYEMLRELRQRPLSSAAPRSELAALAAAFPGALRELDRVSLPELERRLAALHAVVEGRQAAQRWMLLQIAYHGFMRAVLRLKRLLLAQERQGATSVELAVLAYEPAPDEPARERFDVAALAAIRCPPDGRLNPWVLEQVARDLGVTPACIERALWSAVAVARS